MLTLFTIDEISIRGVYVYQYGRVVCSYSSFVLTSSDPKAEALNCNALRLAGYYGEREGPDNSDSLCPGTLLLSSGCGPSLPAVSDAELGVSWFTPLSPNELADPWAAVFNVVPQTVAYSSTCELYLTNSTSRISAEGSTGSRVAALYDSFNGEWIYLPTFREVSVGRGVFSVLIWCPSLRSLDGVSVVVDAGLSSFTFSFK
jgi:hypothetical protein